MPGLLILLDVFLAAAVIRQSRVFPQKYLGDTTAGAKVSHGASGHALAPRCGEGSVSEEFLEDIPGSAVGTQRGSRELQPLGGSELRQLATPSSKDSQI